MPALDQDWGVTVTQTGSALSTVRVAEPGISSDDSFNATWNRFMVTVQDQFANRSTPLDSRSPSPAAVTDAVIVNDSQYPEAVTGSVIMNDSQL